ncbi:MAG TPA: GTPase Era, partial [Moraxellaceae bacterium]|nr:GTPase Era [Moraxellaceae bacterium]
MSNQTDATQQTTTDPAANNPSADNNQDVISQFFSGQ